MAQFDVYPNPIVEDRLVYPYVIQLSSDFVRSVQTRLTAPLSPVSASAQPLERLHPAMVIEAQTYVLETMSMQAHLTSDLRGSIANLRSQVDAIFNSLDFAFHGY
jgi:toxin CcdB